MLYCIILYCYRIMLSSCYIVSYHTITRLEGVSRSGSRVATPPKVRGASRLGQVNTSRNSNLQHLDRDSTMSVGWDRGRRKIRACWILGKPREKPQGSWPGEGLSGRGRIGLRSLRGGISLFTGIFRCPLFKAPLNISLYVLINIKPYLAKCSYK